MLHSSTKRFYNIYLVNSLSKVGSINIASNICIIIAGSYSSSGNLDRFVDISRFYSTGVFSCNSSRGG